MRKSYVTTKFFTVIVWPYPQQWYSIRRPSPSRMGSSMLTWAAAATQNLLDMLLDPPQSLLSATRVAAEATMGIGPLLVYVDPRGTL